MTNIGANYMNDPDRDVMMVSQGMPAAGLGRVQVLATCT